MRIKQFYCGLPFFREGMKKKYNFEDYTNRQEPLFVHGCYGWQSWSNILFKHESLVVFAPAGDDAHKLADPINAFWVNEFKKRPNIKYLANDTWIKEALASVGLFAERVPFTPFTSEDIYPCPLGESIYVYKPNEESYGSELYHKVKERLPQFKFIESEGFVRTREEILQCYRNSFIGLRLMESGGLAVTVIELGLMGRMVIHNGDHPNCIHYDKNDIEGIIEAIDLEYWHAQKPFNNGEAEETAHSVRNFLNISEDFLDTEFYANY